MTHWLSLSKDTFCLLAFSRDLLTLVLMFSVALVTLKSLHGKIKWKGKVLYWMWTIILCYIYVKCRNYTNDQRKSQFIVIKLNLALVQWHVSSPDVDLFLRAQSGSFPPCDATSCWTVPAGCAAALFFPVSSLAWKSVVLCWGAWFDSRPWPDPHPRLSGWTRSATAAHIPQGFSNCYILWWTFLLFCVLY